MIFLSKMKFKEEYLCHPKRFEIDNLLDVTLLVGDQGSGKSTLLSLLGDNDTDKLDITLSDYAKYKGVKTYFFDSEKMNPRTADPHSYSTPMGQDIGIGFGGAVAARFESHGEVLFDMVVGRIKQASDCLIFFDEPESGLSLRSQFKLIDNINEAVERNCQFIIATHCLSLIQKQEKVYSMEHKKWMISSDFIETQMKK